MQAHWTRKLLILPPVLLGGAGLAYLVASKQPPAHKPPAELVRNVRVIEAVKIDVVPRAIGYGSVKPARVWNAVAQVGGRIAMVHPELKKGAILKAGTELIRISPKDYEVAIRQAQANAGSADAKLQELEITQENVSDSLKIEELSLQIKDKELARKKELLRRGTLAQASIDQERRDLLGQRKRVQDLKNTLRLIPAQRASQEQQKAVYQAQLDSARLNLARTSIRLPFDARIAEVNVEITQFAGVGKVLAIADAMHEVEIEAQVPMDRFSMLARAMAVDGAPVGITGKTLGRLRQAQGFSAIVRMRLGDHDVEWPARVARISDTIDPKTRTVGAIVTVGKVYEKAVVGRRPPLIKGMFVEVEFRTSALAGQFVVPRAALHDGRLYVVNDENRLDIRPVTVRLAQANHVVISKGLKAGERIIVSDVSPAIPGMLLKFTHDEDLAARLKAEAAGAGAAR